MAKETFPRNVIRQLEQTRNLTVVKFDEGIYHISGEIFPVQIIHTAKLSKENNFWLKNLTNDLRTREDAQNLLENMKRDKKKIFISPLWRLL